MFTKTIKKYIGLGLVLAFCSASSMAQSYTQVLSAAQYRPVAGLYMGLHQGLSVTGTTLTGCTASGGLTNVMLPPLASDGTGDEEPSPIGLYYRTLIMDISTKAKVGNRSIALSYDVTGSGPSGCRITAIEMR